VFKDPTISAIARRLDRSPAQIALRWLIQQKRVIAIPRTGTVARLGTNFAACDFVLSDDDMAAVSRLKERNGRIVDSSYSPTWD
jgi:diketogulonate reductase-like aldo/keto reductase